MPGRLVHFELPADDTSRALAFYGSLFGWTFEPWSGPVEYHQTQAGGGPGGAIYPSQEGERGPIVYFDTDDIAATVQRVRDLGGSADDPQPIPGIGWFSRCRDTEGNPISLFQADESVPVPDEHA
jgi:predicted enzyme related to lactoylglutathione lyase